MESSNKNKLSKDDYLRYSRHLTLPGFGINAQEKLINSNVLVVGAGGLGSPIIIYLAAAGVGRIGIVDFDIVDKSNLQRQIIHNVKWIGKPKVESAKERVKEINPNIIVEVHYIKLNDNNVLDTLKEYDLVCDGTDNFESRYLLNDASVILKKPYIYGSILQFEGHVSVFNLKDNSPSYRDFIYEAPPEGMVPSCAEGGVIGVLPGVIGTIQATEAIKVLTGIGKPLDGRLLIYDAIEMRFTEFEIKKDPKRESIDKIKASKQDQGSINTKNSSVEISVKELNSLRSKESDEIALIDVRTIQERNICSIKESIHIPLNKIIKWEFTNEEVINIKNRIIIVYCKTGVRSEKAIEIFKKHGLAAKTLKGGIIEWGKVIDNSINLY
ncbi:molybdopterin biosynthesis protein MoeB [Synechococcus sp. MEDNS5]|uniref:molybdopterin-synthase adenylyltransferase MoeB n=1 Tax=Synechococcus sp. MEDNS5 TaxID=1442554 RepID=UPI0016471679|nr:molybdopterin-synthase adenylyltransferase MoeB [Synechococcus sp. MEDNS5]QNJ06871.1 molybdopterin biosynthesis protein MoeB [Synechococcus sp. MEDNS5]